MIKWRRIRGAGHIAGTRDNRNSCILLVVKTEGKRPLRKPRRTMEGNIKTDLR
jgi:hypothetical protein